MGSSRVVLIGSQLGAQVAVTPVGSSGLQSDAAMRTLSRPALVATLEARTSHELTSSVAITGNHCQSPPTSSRARRPAGGAAPSRTSRRRSARCRPRTRRLWRPPAQTQRGTGTAPARRCGGGSLRQPASRNQSRPQVERLLALHLRRRVDVSLRHERAIAQGDAVRFELALHARRALRTRVRAKDVRHAGGPQ